MLQAKLRLVLFVIMLAFTTFIFDLAITSYSIMPYRIIYDVGFALIISVFFYLAQSIIGNASFKQISLIYTRYFPVLIIAFNVLTVCAVLTFGVPFIGSFSESVSNQVFFALMSLIFFAILAAGNGLLLYIMIHKSSRLRLYEIATYALAVIVIEVSFSIYAYNIANVEAIKYFLTITHLLFIFLTVVVYRRLKHPPIIEIGHSEILLLLLSAGIFCLTFVPFGIYNLYADNAVIVGNILSILNRGSLEPYYLADYYYSPLMGFVSIVFELLTGFNNTLLSVNLPFLMGSLFLPFVAYHFFKSHLVQNEHVALIGAFSVSVMDGLAVLLLPHYFGGLSNELINNTISPATQSLYYSNIIQLFVTPYKTFAAVCAIAACGIMEKKYPLTFVLAGALFFMSFSDPRFSIITILLVILLLVLKRLDLKLLALFAVSVVFFTGYTIPVHLYKQSSALIGALCTNGLIESGSYQAISSFANSLISYDFDLVFVPLAIICCVVLFVLLNQIKCKSVQQQRFAYQLNKNNSPDKGQAKLELRVSSRMTTFISIFIFIMLLLYIILEVYGFFSFPKCLFFFNLNNIVLRYHVLIGLIIIGFIIFCFTKRFALTSVVILFLFGILGFITNSLTCVPIVIVALAIPVVDFFIKNNFKVVIIFVIGLIFLGFFSATFYAAIVDKDFSSEYSDLPDVLNILLEYPPGDVVYSPSQYTYFVDRVAKMAHLSLTMNDASRQLYLIDKNYTDNHTLDVLLHDNNFSNRFIGNKFIVLERVSNST